MFWPGGGVAAIAHQSPNRPPLHPLHRNNQLRSGRQPSDAHFQVAAWQIVSSSPYAHVHTAAPPFPTHLCSDCCAERPWLGSQTWLRWHCCLVWGGRLPFRCCCAEVCGFWECRWSAWLASVPVGCLPRRCCHAHPLPQSLLSPAGTNPLTLDQPAADAHLLQRLLDISSVQLERTIHCKAQDAASPPMTAWQGASA